MKKMMYFAAALLVLVGCQKKDNSIENTPDNYGTITGKIELPKTPNKIAAPEGWESATDPFTMVWEEGDKIYLGGNELEMTALDEASGIATFGGVLLDEMSNYGVSYGYDITDGLHFPLVAKYVEGNYRPFARGGGQNSEFTINEFGPVIGLQLKGTDVLTRIEITVGEGHVVTMPADGVSLELQLTSEVQKVYVPYFFIGEYDIQPADMTITFYKADDIAGEVAIMSKTIAQANLPENGKVTTYPTLEVKAAPQEVDWTNALSLGKSDATAIVIETGVDVGSYTEDANHKPLNDDKTLWEVLDGTTLRIQTAASQINSSLDMLFYEYRTVQSITGLGNIHATNARSMFEECESLSYIDFTGFNTENVTDMVNMFYICGSLTSLDLSGFNTENVTDMNNMFMDCESLSTLNLSGFNTENVENMKCMFYNCSALESLTLSNDFKVASEKEYMFKTCGYDTQNGCTVYGVTDASIKAALSAEETGWSSQYSNMRFDGE